VWQTDGRTDRQKYDSQDRPRICSRGKKIRQQWNIRLSNYSLALHHFEVTEEDGNQRRRGKIWRKIWHEVSVGLQLKKDWAAQDRQNSNVTHGPLRPTSISRTETSCQHFSRDLLSSCSSVALFFCEFEVMQCNEYLDSDIFYCCHIIAMHSLERIVALLPWCSSVRLGRAWIVTLRCTLAQI